MKTVILCLAKYDQSYAYRLRKYLKGHTIKALNSDIELIASIKANCTKMKSNMVITSSLKILKRLVLRHDPRVADKDITLEKYKGSCFNFDGIDYLILPPLKALTYSDEADWLFGRWISKLTNPNFPVFPEMDWTQASPNTIDGLLAKAKDAIMIAVDVETKKQLMNPEFAKDDLAEYKGIWAIANISNTGKKKYAPIIPMITMVGYACLYRAPTGELYSETVVIKLESMIDITYMRMFNNLPAPKVMQNGGYDSTYFLRYNAPLHNYIYDTFVYMHSWQPELRRTLAFVASIFDKYSVYWKDDGEHNMMEYNAKDCHNTLWAMVYMLYNAPEYALKNYYENFRMQFPCIHCGVEGFARDDEARRALHVERLQKVNEDLARLGKLVVPNFNPNSPKQCLQLLKGLGFTKATASDDKTLQVFIDSHPLWDIVGNLIKDCRVNRKANSTYFESTALDGRILYELNPAGTDTGRMASKASNLWVGLQIQNVPLYAKSMFIADKGYKLNAADYKQSESRCTAYISEDINLINVVEDDKDFHKNNATMFFGMSYDEVTPDVRKTGKKVNHGANYNMGWRVLLESMGRKAVLEAARLLKLPRSMTLKEICEYLLACFDKAYPDVRGKYYDEVISEIATTGMLVGATGWTRRCLGKPSRTGVKHILNSYVAHAPQSLSVKLINDAFFKTWRYQIETEKLRLKAQVHDEIIWQDKDEHREENCEVIRGFMEVTTVVRGREMLIPADFSIGATNWHELKAD